jgi:hypothetical protein
MKELARGTLKAIESEIWLATLSLKLDVLIAALQRRYPVDQPRAPKGTPDGEGGLTQRERHARHGSGLPWRQISSRNALALAMQVW